MGCDGGTIPKRDELVRTKKKPEQKDKNSELSFRWGHCCITQQPLQMPIVACQLGRLYSKVAVLEAILDKTALPDTCNHIKSIKDVKNLKLTENPAFKNKATTGDSLSDNNISPYICPVIGLEMTGKFRFVYLWTCGCVLSERALKAVNTKVCHKCQVPYSEEDIIVLNGDEADVDRLRTMMESRQARIKAEKKAKKGKASASNGVAVPDNTEGSSEKPSTSGVPSTSCKSNSKLMTKRPATSKIEDPDFKKTKANYSVAKDPKATEVFKSLFTSHKTASQQTKAHWITYNPFYN